MQSSLHMKEPFLGINLNTYSYDEFIQQSLELIKMGKSSYTCVANVHMLVEAHNDSQFADVVNEAELCAADGVPLVWGLKILKGIKQDRICGMDLLPDLMKKAEQTCIPVYFYGGKLDMLDQAKVYINKVYPKLPIAGMHSPPFRPLTFEEEETIVEMINSSGARLLIVALGCPKQEKWMAAMKGRIQMPMIGIGGALPVMAGLQSRAPVWAQKAGLEWLFRLLQEPRRLFKRYAITNSAFLILFMKSWLIKRAD